MDDRLVLDSLDLAAGTSTLYGASYPLLDASWPTLRAPDCAALTEDEAALIDDLRYQFQHSERLQEHIRFLGFQRVEALMPQIGLVVLSSISEALPLVLLEGYAAGVPTVTTDVGSCRQLVEGLDDEDRALGHSGMVVPIADPQRLADAALALLGDTAAWQAASQAAIARVERYYTDTLMFARYRKVYETALERTPPAPHAPGDPAWQA